MKTKTKTKKQTQEQTLKKPHSGGKVAFFAFLGILIVAVIVGISIFWEKKLEPLVGVDLPDESQETSEVSSIIPYICDQDPENCKAAPLTFRGSDSHSEREKKTLSPSQEETKSSDSSILTSDEGHSESSTGMAHSLELISTLKTLEEKLDVIEDVINEFDSLKNEVENLRLVMLIRSVEDGDASFDFIIPALSASSNSFQKQFLEQLPKKGHIVPFPQIPLQTIKKLSSSENSVQKGGGFDFKLWWEDSLHWLETVVQVKTPADVEEEAKVTAFREAAISGDYPLALSLYKNMTEPQQYAYALWYSQIEDLSRLELIRLDLLQQLQKGV